MRDEQAMMDLILGIAKEDERVRAVYMNGSRTNANAAKDMFQDYDIVYVVRETESFINDRTWIDKFGPRLYMQRPEEMDALLGHQVDMSQNYGWLMQLADGNRIDLHVETGQHAVVHITEDKLCRILLDKDQLLPEMPPSTDEDYWVRKPSETEFACCCNEFWWCLNNVAKGLWRKEVPYVQDMCSLYIRPQLVKMLSWKAGIQTDYSVSIGKNGKYLYRYIETKEWEQFLLTYAGAGISEMWEAVSAMCLLFHQTAGAVSDKLGYVYDEEEAVASYGFLKHVRTLPEDAEEIY